jgi:hypothetical protein
LTSHSSPSVTRKKSDLALPLLLFLYFIVEPLRSAFSRFKNVPALHSSFFFSTSTFSFIPPSSSSSLNFPHDLLIFLLGIPVT